MKPKEADYQKAVFAWAEMSRGKYPELELLYHAANERKCSAAAGAELKRLGVKSGVPDICLPVPKGKYHGLYIELKRDGCKPSENQLKWLEALKAQGYYAEWIVGAEFTIETLKWYLGGAR